MKRRRKILFLGACGLVAIVAVCFFFLREQEPSYNGRALSEWLDVCVTNRSPMWSRYVEPEVADKHDERNLTAKQRQAKKQAREAVCAIGPDALPYLADWIGATEPAWKSVIYNHTSWSAKRRFLYGLFGDPAKLSLQHARAAEGILILKSDAAPILPRLIRCFENRTSEHDLMRISTAIAEVRNGSLEYLLNAARSSNDSIHRYFAVAGISVMQGFGTNVSAVVPILKGMINGEDSFLAARAATYIAVFRLSPEQIIPALTNAIATRDVEVVTNSIYALQAFDAQQTKVALAILYPALVHTNEPVRKAATQTVRQIEQALATNKAAINN